MKEIPLTNSDLVAIVDDEDYDRVMMFDWAIYGTSDRIYVRRCLIGESKKISLGQFLLGYKKGLFVVCLNNNNLDNRRINLRYGDYQAQRTRKRIQTNNTSGYKGVSWIQRRNKYYSYIMIDKKTRSLGFYSCKECAAVEYNKAAKQNFGEFTRLNEIKDHDCGKFGED